VSQANTPLPVDVFSTAPQSAHVEAEDFLPRARDVARWSEEAGCRGILVYTDNRLVDPWLVSQAIIETTETLCPLVATQPAYMHPYSVAKMIASFGYLYGRQVYLNMVAGGFKHDLEALGDPTPHDDRYKRLEEYTSIVLDLLRSPQPISFEGRFYDVTKLQMRPPLDPALVPGVFLSGSSPAGRETAQRLGATAIEYPKPGVEYEKEGPATGPGAGIRVGLIADDDRERAWQIARERFPEDRRGQIAHKMAMKVSDSHWHKQLSEIEDEASGGDAVYWLWPFKNYSTFCPYLVGSYDEVSDELARYVRAGFQVFILDIPAKREDLVSAGRVFRMACEKAAP
jgi:alkanesulfonate monooxygenase